MLRATNISDLINFVKYRLPDAMIQVFDYFYQKLDNIYLKLLKNPGVRNAPQGLGNCPPWGVSEVKTKLHYNIYFCIRSA